MKSQDIASYLTPLGQKVSILKQSFSSFQKKPTKRIAFVSGLHGNELEGIYLCHLLILYLKELKKNQPEALDQRKKVIIDSAARWANQKFDGLFGIGLGLGHRIDWGSKIIDWQ